MVIFTTKVLKGLHKVLKGIHELNIRAKSLIINNKQKLMKNIFTFLLITLFTSCKPAENTKNDFLKWVQKGKINQNVICKADQTLSYALYLPSKYNLDSEWPVIVCFDPHGDGTLPVSLFKDLAERKGYIVIGSNNSKNGTDANELSHIVDVLFADCKEKLMLDYKRVYLAGFSGGSRVASSVATTFGSIAGVIGCSAGFQPTAEQKQFNFIGIAGTDDMNYLEVKQLDSVLNIWPAIKHQFIQFDGTHKWPPIPVLEQAINTFELYGMRENRVKVNNSAINTFKQNNIAKIQNLEKTNNIDSLAKAFRIINNTLNALQGLTDLSDLQKIHSEMLTNATLTNYLKNVEITEQQESIIQRGYAQQYTVKSIDWWTNEIKKLINMANNKSNSLESHSCKRLLAFISLISYSYVNSAIAQQNWGAANHFLQIYGMADPENPDYYYFKACAEANTGKQTQAIETLKTAMKFGFTSKQKLTNDPLLEPIRHIQGFEELLK